MARIDFYILDQAGPKARLVFACRLAEKAWRLDNTVHVLAEDDRTARELDELLWTFRDGSFVPHERIGAGEPESPVTIGTPGTPPGGGDLLKGGRHNDTMYTGAVDGSVASTSSTARTPSADAGRYVRPRGQVSPTPTAPPPSRTPTSSMD